MYKKRIKDWAIDKNQKSERPHASPRTRQHRDLPGESQSSSVRSAAIGAPQLSISAASSSPGLVQSFQYDTRPSAEGAMQTGYHIPGTMLPSQQGQQQWTGASQPYSECPFTSSVSQQGQFGQQSRTSALLSSIRDRFLEASDAITRHDTAVLFEILNPAYETISSVAETETAQLLAVIVEIFQMLSRRPNHQDILRQLLDYTFALIPDAGRQNQFLSSNSQVLALLGQAGYASPSSGSMSLDTTGATASRLTVPPQNYGYYEQPARTGSASGSRS